jgi:hypothetical protein
MRLKILHAHANTVVYGNEFHRYEHNETDLSKELEGVHPASPKPSLTNDRTKAPSS